MRSQNAMRSSASHSSADTAPTVNLIEHSRFHARACLLAVLSKQQDLSSLNGDTEKRDVGANDDDSEDDSENVGSDAGTVVPRELVKAADEAKIKKSFLDRLAEVLAREKPQQGEKNKHVAATAIVEEDDEVTVYIAKNGGFDETDSSMLHLLEIWMRAIAADGRRRDIKKDAMWRKLVEYYQKRLGYCQQRLKKIFGPYLTTSDMVHATRDKLCRLTKLRPYSGAAGPAEGHEIVCLAYELRYGMHTTSDLDVIAKSASKKLWQCIILLSRLRVAYETFIETALRLSVFKKMKIVEINAGVNEEVAKQMLHAMPPIVSAQFGRLTSRQRKMFKRRLALPCFVHAEIQLLMQLERPTAKDSNAARVFRYIGCSKKTCYLCCKFIEEHGSFRTRGTHGKVYDQWTVPASSDIPLSSAFRIKVALLNVENDMITRFENCLGSRQLPHVPESSIGISEHSEASMYRYRLRQLGLDTEASQIPDCNEQSKDPPVTKLGKRRTSFRAARIPADSNYPMEIVRLVTHETDDDYHCCDSGMRHVPNFARFWEGNYNSDRAMFRFDANDQKPRSLNGDYRVHWNINDELPENENLKKLLRLVDVPIHRRFWYGDVFIERIGEKDGRDHDEHGYHVYDDIPPEILDSQLLASIFREYWNRMGLEDSLKEDAEIQAFSQKGVRDRDLLFQRMYVRNSFVLTSANIVL